MEHPENNDTYKGLTVNAGIELSVADYVDGIIKGDVTILSRAVTLVESIRPEHQAIAQEVIEKCLPYSGASIRVGISGVPGAGKSTSIDVFGLHVLEQYGGKLAVLAIDPSSERSKGSILGDKTRMERLAVHAWSDWPCTPNRSSAPAPRQVRWAAWHARRGRPSCCARQRASTRYSWRPWAWVRARRPCTAW